MFFGKTYMHKFCIALILNVEGFYYVELEYYTISRTRRFGKRNCVAFDIKYFRNGEFCMLHGNLNISKITVIHRQISAK